VLDSIEATVHRSGRFADQRETLNDHPWRSPRNTILLPFPSPSTKVGSWWVIQILLQRHNRMRFGRRSPRTPNRSPVPAARTVLAICRQCAKPATRVTKLGCVPPMKLPWMVGHSHSRHRRQQRASALPRTPPHATSHRSSASSKKQSTCSLRTFGNGALAEQRYRPNRAASQQRTIPRRCVPRQD
jgi:hypothetical protein